MIAIYKKELRQYFTSLIGFAFLAFFLAIIGIYSWVYNFISGIGNFEVTLSSISFLYVILVPILTMRIVAEENHLKTNQLLYTAPVSVTKIILGKFASVLTLFLIGILIICLYPLVISLYGSDVQLSMAYSSIIGFFLLGAACMAVGLFISALTESQAIAAVVTFIVLLVSFLLSSISAQIPSGALPQCVLIAAVWLAVAAFVRYMTKNIHVAIGFFAVGEIVIWVIYIIRSSVYEGLFNKFLNVLAIADHFDDFGLGILNYDSVLYYVSVIFLFLFFTIQIIRSKQYKQGTYGSVLIILITCIVVAANLVCAQFDLSSDLSSGKLFTLSDDSVASIENLDHGITVYYMVSEGSEESYIENVLKQYKKLDNITLKKVDPVVNPGFAAKHGIDDDIVSNDVIVENDDTGTAKYISCSDLYYYTYTSSGSYAYYLDVEGQVTSAALSVASEERTKVYVMTRHNEQELGESVYDAMEKMNIETEDLELATLDAVPGDCDILIVNGPEIDFTDSEKDMVLDYLTSGGAAMLNVCYTTEETPNYDEILAYYGVGIEDGVVYETNGHYMSYINYIVPETSLYSGLLADLSGYILFPSAVGLSIPDEEENVRDTVNITQILTTSDGSFVKADPSDGETDMTEGDIAGPFSAGLYITETIGDEKSDDKDTLDEDTLDEDLSEGDDSDSEDLPETKLIVYSSAYAFLDSFTYTSQIENLQVFKESLSTLSSGSVQEVSVEAKSLDYSYVSVPPIMQSFWAAVMIVLLPLALLISGLVIWLRRRRR